MKWMLPSPDFFVNIDGLGTTSTVATASRCANSPSFSMEFNRNAVAGYGVPSQDSLLRDYLRVLIKSKWVVITTVLLFVSVVTISTLRTTPIYEAVGSIAINKMDPVTFNLKDSSSSVDYYDPADLDTEVRILKSDLLALQVIRQLNLDKQPDGGKVKHLHPGIDGGRHAARFRKDFRRSQRL